MINIDLSIFKEDELEYIVNVIPRERAIGYLQRNSKEFSKIRPGFRAARLSDNQLYSLLYKEFQKGNNFVVTLVLAFLESSIKEITEAYQTKCKNCDETTALIYTLNDCFFRDRIEIYFKLSNKEVSHEEMKMLVAAMNLLNESINQHRIMIKNLESKDEQILSLENGIEKLISDNKQLTKNNDAIISQNKKLHKDIEKASTQNKELSEEVSQHKGENKKLTEDINSLLGENEELRQKLVGMETNLQCKESELQTLLKEKDALVEKLNEKTESNEVYLLRIKELEEAFEKQSVIYRQYVPNENIWSVSPNASKFYVPEDQESFQELLEYFLEDSGIIGGKALLKSYINRIAFSGKPIVGNRQDCYFLVNCLRSVLTNGNSTTLNFSDEITINDISNVLNGDNRIVYLDNFIGNFNETVLYSLLEKFHSKIIIISAMFDRSFNYVGTEFLSLCHYFNVSRLNYTTVCNFDSEFFEEKVYIPTSEILPNTPTSALKSVLKDLNLPKCTRQSLITNIETHDDATGILAFCIIPYLLDVRGKNPYDSSERLNEYCEKNRNRYLLSQWFGYE